MLPLFSIMTLLLRAIFVLEIYNIFIKSPRLLFRPEILLFIECFIYNFTVGVADPFAVRLFRPLDFFLSLIRQQILILNK